MEYMYGGASLCSRGSALVNQRAHSHPFVPPGLGPPHIVRFTGGEHPLILNGAGSRLTMPEFRVDPADCSAPQCVSRFCFKRLLGAPVLGANEVIFSSRSPPAFVP